VFLRIRCHSERAGVAIPAWCLAQLEQNPNDLYLINQSWKMSAAIRINKKVKLPYRSPCRLADGSCCCMASVILCDGAIARPGPSFQRRIGP